MNPKTRQPIPEGKGIALNPSQLKQLIDAATNFLQQARECFADTTVKEYSAHLGYGTYITKKRNDFVDIRRYFKPGQEPQAIPTRKGSMLLKSEFERFLTIMPKIMEYFPAIAQLDSCDCMMENNQLAAMFCRNCNPFDYIDF